MIDVEIVFNININDVDLFNEDEVSERFSVILLDI